MVLRNGMQHIWMHEEDIAGLPSYLDEIAALLHQGSGGHHHFLEEKTPRIFFIVHLSSIT